ncbi:MAG: DMT family transporter [Firmicutes bacterium]|nr:DMT family transporter [Bacillota bacterium]
MSKRTKSNLLLLIASVIWGFAFVAQKAGTALEPFTYNGVRFLIGGIALIPLIVFFSKGNSDNTYTHTRSQNPIIKAGLICGTILAIASNLQQFGIYFDTDAGKAGFITSLYIVMVPILGVFLNRKAGLRLWLCVLLGAVGFYLLTMASKSDGLTLEKGDFFVLLCALIFSVHILAIDYYSPKCDGIKLSALQFFVAAVISFVCMLFTESPSIPAILGCWPSLLYVGIMSSGVGYTFQILGQKDANPSAAALILSLEAVFAVIGGVLLLGEKLGAVEILGCVIIFAAVIISQLPSKLIQDN